MGRALLRRAWFPALLLALTVGLYGPSLRFGLIWDDPRWYQQGAGQTLWQLLVALPTYQFYRPLAIWLNQQLVSPAGVVNAPLAHGLQLAAHAGVVLACAPALQAFGIKKDWARGAALLFALNPIIYQAVAWQAPQQPLAMLWVLLAVLLAARYTQSQQIRNGLISAGLYAVALLFQESAVPFAALFVWLAVWQKTERPRQRLWPLIHLGLAAAYLLIWINVPRASGPTGQGGQWPVLGYLLQSVVYPATALAAPVMAQWSLPMVISACGLMMAVLVGYAWASSGWRPAALGALWLGAGLLPIWVGLSWDYVQIGARLLYPAGLGIALVWAACLLSLWHSRILWKRAVAVGLALSVMWVSGAQWWSQQQLYQRGTQHLAQTVRVLSEHAGQHLLFINYPDRIEFRSAPYPLGVWGLTLAPVVQDLADYALAAAGHSGSDESLSVFLAGAAEREAWPYGVFMRGSDTPPAEVLAAAQRAEAVYLTDYLADGSLRLRAVGAARAADENAPVLARLGEAVELNTAQMADGKLQLVWTCRAPLREGDTIFVHVWQAGAFVAAADGDTWGGVLPLSAWQPGAQLMDERGLADLNLPAGQYEVSVGIYSRWDNTRYPAYNSSGQRWPDDEISVGAITLP